MYDYLASIIFTETVECKGVRENTLFFIMKLKRKRIIRFMRIIRFTLLNLLK